MKAGYVYILASQRNGTLYIGVTSDLVKRIYEHKQHVCDGFTKKYEVTQLVYFEALDTIETAIHREKRLKKYTRIAKIALIESQNPAWEDKYEYIAG